MGRRLAAVVSLLVALVVACPATASAEGPRAWMTTGDHTNLLTELPATAFGDPVGGAPTITVDSAHQFQKVEGFGASITDSSAHLLAESPHRDEIMRDLFHP